MADRHPPEANPQANAPQATKSFQTFEPSPEPSTTEDSKDRPKGMLSLLALLGAALIAGLLMFFASRLAGVPGTSEVLLVSLIAFVVALVGMIPMRWGLFVVPGVTIAGFGYITFSMFFAENSIFQRLPADSFGYALFLFGGAVVLGFVAQGVYSAIMRL